MAKKKNPAEKSMPDFAALLDKLPKEQQQRVLSIKQSIEAFKDTLLKKFEDNIISIALLPQVPQQQQQPSGPTIQSKQVTPQQAPQEEEIRVLILVEDAGTKKTPEELKQQLLQIITPLAKEQHKDFVPHILLISELWQSCFDGKDEMTKMLTLASPVYDKGTLAAVKIAEIHKNMVLQQFERYIVSYVLAGSIVQGRATAESDIDVFVVVDDTDVKKMTRKELTDKLRAIIITKGIEAGELTGIRNKLNIQVYILTDFWEHVKDANPIIFTFLRDGVPLYDRGTFMPWKQLLRMGRIKPSQEAIDTYVHTGEQVLERAQLKLREIGMEDTFWSILTPTQAALMLYGIAPPTPKETADVVRELFVKKEKMLEEKYVAILESHIELRKNLEHGKQKKLTGKELDAYLMNCEQYLERLEKLFVQLNERKAKESVTQGHESVIAVVRDVLEVAGIEQPEENQIETVFENSIIKKGKLPLPALKLLKNVFKAQQHYLADKLTKTEIETVRKDATSLIRQLTDYIQRERLAELGKARLRIKHGQDKYGEVMLLDNKAYIIHDIKEKKGRVSMANITPDGKLKDIQSTTEEVFEKVLATAHVPKQTFIGERLFESLREFFGRDVEIQVV